MTKPTTFIMSSFLLLVLFGTARATSVESTFTPAQILPRDAIARIHAEIRDLIAQERELGRHLYYLEDQVNRTRSHAAHAEFQRGIQHLQRIRHEKQARIDFLRRRIVVRLVDDPQGKLKLPRLKWPETVEQFVRRHGDWAVRQRLIVVGTPIQPATGASSASSRSASTGGRHSTASGNRGSRGVVRSSGSSRSSVAQGRRTTSGGSSRTGRTSGRSGSSSGAIPGFGDLPAVDTGGSRPTGGIFGLPN